MENRQQRTPSIFQAWSGGDSRAQPTHANVTTSFAGSDIRRMSPAHHSATALVTETMRPVDVTKVDLHHRRNSSLLSADHAKYPAR
jgi:hypothetical protein